MTYMADFRRLARTKQDLPTALAETLQGGAEDIRGYLQDRCERKVKVRDEVVSEGGNRVRLDFPQRMQQGDRLNPGFFVRADFHESYGGYRVETGYKDGWGRVVRSKAFQLAESDLTDPGKLFSWMEGGEPTSEVELAEWAEALVQAPSTLAESLEESAEVADDSVMDPHLAYLLGKTPGNRFTEQTARVDRPIQEGNETIKQRVDMELVYNLRGNLGTVWAVDHTGSGSEVQRQIGQLLRDYRELGGALDLRIENVAVDKSGLLTVEICSRNPSTISQQNLLNAAQGVVDGLMKVIATKHPSYAYAIYGGTPDPVGAVKGCVTADWRNNSERFEDIQRPRSAQSWTERLQGILGEGEPRSASQEVSAAFSDMLTEEQSSEDPYHDPRPTYHQADLELIASVQREWGDSKAVPGSLEEMTRDRERMRRLKQLSRDDPALAAAFQKAKERRKGSPATSQGVRTLISKTEGNLNKLLLKYGEGGEVTVKREASGPYSFRFVFLVDGRPMVWLTGQESGDLDWIIRTGPAGRKKFQWQQRVDLEKADSIQVDKPLQWLRKQLRAARSQREEAQYGSYDALVEADAFLKHCVAGVAPKRGKSSAFAICTAQGQKSGYYEPGTKTLTDKGEKAARSKSAQKGHKEKVADYEKAIGRQESRLAPTTHLMEGMWWERG